MHSQEHVAGLKSGLELSLQVGLSKQTQVYLSLSQNLFSAHIGSYKRIYASWIAPTSLFVNLNLKVFPVTSMLSRKLTVLSLSAKLRLKV